LQEVESHKSIVKTNTAATMEHFTRARNERISEHKKHVDMIEQTIQVMAEKWQKHQKEVETFHQEQERLAKENGGSDVRVSDKLRINAEET